MGSAGESFSNRIPIALAALLALVFVAGLAAVAGWLAIALKAPPEAASPFAAASPACRICGVVEEVRELKTPYPAQALNGDQSESIVILIAALGGGPGRLIALPRAYETAVRFEDGSVRVLRDAREPLWKRGDYVKVTRGRVEPLHAEPRAAAEPLL